MRTIVSRKTRELLRETIKNRGYSLKHYIEIFGDHDANDFPSNVEEDFMLKALANKRVDGRTKKIVKPLSTKKSEK